MRASPHLALGLFTLAALLAGLAQFLGTDPKPRAGFPLEVALPLHEVVADPRRYAGRRVVARGYYDRAETVFVTGERRERARGARVFTPLQLAAGEGALVVLVDRGWIPDEELDTFVERDEASEEREVFGTLYPEHFGEAPRHLQASQRRWSSLRPAALQSQLAYTLLPLILVREAGSGVELPIAPVSAPPTPVVSPLWWVSGGCALAGAVAFALRTRE